MNQHPDKSNPTQTQLLENFYYKDGFLYWKAINSNRAKINTKAGTITTHGRRFIRLSGKSLMSNRAIFLFHHGYLPEMVDHINHDFTDDRIENLRAATRSQNQRNRKGANKNSTSKFLGVSLDKRNRNTWRANIYVDGKQTFLGNFETEIEAAIAYNNAAIIHFNEFASLNKL